MVLTIITGALHAMGCRGKRPAEKVGEKRLSAPFIEIPKRHGDKFETHYAASAHDIPHPGHGSPRASRKHSRA